VALVELPPHNFATLMMAEEQRIGVFESRVLRIIGPKRDEETGGWRKLHNEEFYNLHFSPSIIRMIKSRRMRWAVHTKLRGFSPQANYTDRATALYRRRWCQLLRIEGVAWSAQRITTAVNLRFLDPELLTV
jgi:hypothetical protein